MQVPTGDKLPKDGRVQMYPCHSFEFHVVLMAIDPVLGKPEIRRYVIGHDCGTVINPHIVKGMTLGGIAHGLGAALLEEFVYDDEGHLITQSFMDYLLPSVTRSAGGRDRASLHAVPAHGVRPEGLRRKRLSRRAGGDCRGGQRLRRAARHFLQQASDPHFRHRRCDRGRTTGQTPRASDMIIDCHAHLVPPSLLDAIRARAASFPSIRLIEESGSLGFSFAGGKPTRPVSKPLSDLPARLRWMDEQNIERQVVGGWLDMFGYEVPAEEGANWARLINTHLAQTAMREPRFVPLATVPLQDGARAAEVLREAHAAGFKGAMIGTQPKGKGGVLDDPALNPFWEAANELGSVVFVHPVFESGDDRVHDYGMANAVGRITDTLIAMSRLIYAGHVTRYCQREDRRRNRRRGAALCDRPAAPQSCARQGKLGDPDAALAAMYYDTIVQDPRALRYLADIVGADRIMMGSDMPFPIGDLAPSQDRRRDAILRCRARRDQWRPGAATVRLVRTAS